MRVAGRDERHVARRHRRGDRGHRGRESIRASASHSTPYPARIRERAAGWCRDAGRNRAESRGLISNWANCTRAPSQRAVRRYGPVELIGCHGQTIYHEGGVNTLQIGEAGGDRRAHRRAGGLRISARAISRPEARARRWFRSSITCSSAIRARTRIALNIGGIANITVIPAGAAPERRGGLRYRPRQHGDRRAGAGIYERQAELRPRRPDRRVAASVDRELLDDLLADAYYRRQPPKSAGREQYGAEFVARMKRSACRCAT